MNNVACNYPSRLRMDCGLTFVVNGRPTSGMTFQGTVNAAGTEIQISFGNDTMTLKRTTNPPTIPKRLAESEFIPRENSDLQGYWTGTLGTGPGALPLKWKIAEESTRHVSRRTR